MRNHLAVRGCAVVLVCLVISGLSWAQVEMPPVRPFHETAISPDGKRVAWVEGHLDANGDPTGSSSIYVLDLKVPQDPAKRISATTANADEGSVAWSPDSKQLAFLSDAEKAGQSQVYVSDLGNAAPRKLTSVTGYLAETSWSPDGKSIAFLFTENAPREAGPLAAMTPEVGLIDQKIYEQRIAVVDVATGKLRQVSPPDMYIHEYDWSPDSRGFAVSAAPGEGDSNWYVVRLYTLPIESGMLKEVHKPALQIAVPRWSPDGKNIAFIGGIMSDEGSIGGDIFVVPAGGGEPRNVTPGIAASPAWLSWTSNDKILFVEAIDGEEGVGNVEVSSSKVTQVWRAPGGFSAGNGADISLASDARTMAAIKSSSTEPPEICVGAVGECKTITHANQAVKPDWGEMKSLHWTSDGMRVQGWLLYPKNYDPKQKYPMIVVPHGGPAAMFYASWPGRFFSIEALSKRGYFVLAPNPRGSYGSGEAFTRGNIKDFGYGDFRDIMAGVDEVVKTLPVDNDRIGITGWSYGGYMTMWAVTQTNRFHAAVSGAGLSNFQSYYGQNDIDEWMVPYFGATVYDDPAVYAKSSPITFIKNAKTPTLIVVGERDGECPAPQSREFWHALKALGVETQLVIYPGEGHAIAGREHRKDIMNRLTAWFDDHLKAK